MGVLPGMMIAKLGVGKPKRSANQFVKTANWKTNLEPVSYQN
jgi:hypothetical protein